MTPCRRRPPVKLIVADEPASLEYTGSSLYARLIGAVCHAPSSVTLVDGSITSTNWLGPARHAPQTPPTRAWTHFIGNAYRATPARRGCRQRS